MTTEHEERFELDGLSIFERQWRPETNPRAVIALVHGYAEHSGRYAKTGRWFAERGIAVEALDLRGHGRSDGERALVGSFNEYLRDVGAFLRRVRERNPGVPVFLLGHSMGGNVVTLFVLTRQPDVRGVILSGPAFLRRGRQRGLTRLLMPFAKIAPGFGLFQLPAGSVSRDPEVVRLYDEDPLVYRGKFKLGLLAAAGRSAARIERDMEQFSLPLLIVHGTEDRLVPLSGSEELLQRVSSQDKELKRYPGLYHEVLNEPEREEVLGDILAWIEARIPEAAVAKTSQEEKT